MATLLSRRPKRPRPARTTLNQFINVAVAEKLAALRTERHFRERAGRAAPADFLAILDKAGSDAALPGDELPTA